MSKHLLLRAPAPELQLPVTRIGGVPVAPVGFGWPHCAECQRPMRFVAQVALADAGLAPDRLLLSFMCADELCSSGQPDAGANCAVCVAVEGATRTAPPPDAPSGPCHGLQLRPFDGAYEHARTQIEPSEFVYGHVGVAAESVSKFVPTCKRCGVPMQFVVQLEQGPDIDTAFNFNGTTACAYVCTRCFDEAVMFVDDFY